jgi:hypothetical protein
MTVFRCSGVANRRGLVGISVSVRAFQAVEFFLFNSLIKKDRIIFSSTASIAVQNSRMRFARHRLGTFCR